MILTLVKEDRRDDAADSGCAPEEDSFDRVYAAGVAAWPSIDLPRATFVAFVRERCGDGPPSALEITDLYLACACLGGNASAWRELDRLHLSRVPTFVARIDRSAAFGDEIRQRLSEKLLSGDDGRPKLAFYTGRGQLGGWLRVAAVREALNAKRRGMVDVGGGRGRGGGGAGGSGGGTGAGASGEGNENIDDLVIAAREDDPEVQLLKRKYAREFTDAFRHVLATLEPDQRNVLRLHYLDGLSLEEVGKAYRVSRATAARWIADAKRTLVARVHENLGERLGDDGPGAQSLLSLVRSQLHLSLRRHFDPSA
jgi:RNA polymerase sigma-70 factor, ECF subfamily